MVELISPNSYSENIDKPLIFLAGPIRGAPKWHQEAIDYLSSKEDEIMIVSPHRPGGIKISSERFSRQREWELHYLDVASKMGAVMFWLPGEAEHYCNKSYGAMTRLELGEMIASYKTDRSLHFCIGTDGKFSEFDTIKVDMKEYAPYKKIFSSLEETCDEALIIVDQQSI